MHLKQDEIQDMRKESMMFIDRRHNDVMEYSGMKEAIFLYEFLSFKSLFLLVRTCNYKEFRGVTDKKYIHVFKSVQSVVKLAQKVLNRFDSQNKIALWFGSNWSNSKSDKNIKVPG